MTKTKKSITKKSKPSLGKKPKTNIGKDILLFPKKLLTPITDFLADRLAILEKRRKEIGKEDPFRDASRLIDNASPDDDAAEQFGHARTAAIREQLQKKIVQTKKALGRLKSGKYGLCEDCGKMIDTDRLTIYPEATLCASCQAKREK